MRKTISVNDPLRYGGITIYQTDWGFSALQVSKDGEGPFNLAMAPLLRNGDKKLYGTFLPVGDNNSSSVKGMWVCYIPIYILHTEPQECFEVILIILNFLHRSMLARDLQSIALYDQEGKFVGVRRPSSKLPIDIDGMKIMIEDAIGSTGLDLKVNNLKQIISQIQTYDFCFRFYLFDCFFLDGSRGTYCLCWIWCFNAHNLHQLSISFTG